MDKKDVAAILSEIGTLLELKGENPFKSRAYTAGARAIEGLEEDLRTLVSENRLQDVPGIGEGLAQKISELVRTGHLPYYEELKKELPAGLQEMLRIPGLGPKKIKQLHDRLGIASIGELEYACNENRLVELPGFGKKTQDNIMRGISFVRKYQHQFLYSTACDVAAPIVAALSHMKQVTRVSIAGSLRRKKELVKDIDIVVSTPDSPAVMERFTALPQAEGIIAKGDTKSSIITAAGIQVDVRTVSDREFPYALHHFTGSKEHNIALRGRAIHLGMKMNEYGLFTGDRLIVCTNEEEIFHALQLDYIPPELREDRGELAAAEHHRLPRLIEDQDLHGVFHVHSNHSDGTSSLMELAREAQQMGYTYLGIAEHSQSARYARGLTGERLTALFDEIDGLNRRLQGFRLLKGTEADILPDGTLDYPDTLLAGCDFVIASVHSHFTLSEADMTNRIIRALRNPFVTMLGHPTGRLLLSREPYAVDMPRVIEVAAQAGVALEINAHPLRLDLDWRLCQFAKTKGAKMAINPDAHTVAGLRDVAFGVNVARKGWLEPADVLNSMRLEHLLTFLAQRKNRARRK